MKISENFTLEELTSSDTASRLGIVNVPSAVEVANLRRLCAEILEPLRLGSGKVIVITSGYRSPELNAAIKGSKTSDHMSGRAADIKIPGMSPLNVCGLIVALNLPFKQVIHEFGAWCHVSIPDKGVAPRKEQLTIDKRGTRAGLHP